MNLSKLSKKYGLWIVLYIASLVVFYHYGVKLWLPYIYQFLFFLTFIFILENLRHSSLNEDLLKLFKYFYFINAFILLISAGARIFQHPAIISLTGTDLATNAMVIKISWVYIDILCSFVILFISIYLFLFSMGSRENHPSKLYLISGSISLILTLLNFYNFLIHPLLFYSNEMQELYNIKNYLFKIVEILLLLFFWYRYYKKYFVLSEYLDIIIFLFMLSNILQALFFIVYQHNLEFYKYNWYFSLVLNFAVALFWYIRLEYLTSQAGRENEKYLANAQFLEGIIQKPQKNLFQNFISKISLNYVLLFFVTVLIGVLLLYLAKFINLFLMLNTVFILITTLLAIFFSISSIKRDWNRQYGFMFKNVVNKNE